MKKLTALFVALVIIVSCLPVSAAREISLDFLVADYKSGSMEYESVSSYEVNLNKPLEILDPVAEMLSEELPVQPLDLRMMIESLFMLKEEMTVKQRISEQGNKMEAVISSKSNLPFALSGKLTADINATSEIWMDMDISEKKLEYIMDTPVSANKYIVFNEELFTSDAYEGLDVFGLMSAIVSSEKTAEYEKLIIDSIRNNAVITGNSSKVKLVFTDIGLKKFVAEILFGYIKLFGEELGISVEMFSEEQLTMVMGVLSAIRIFDDEALVINCSIDGKGRIKASDFKLNVAVNIYDILTVFEADAEGLTKENSDISFTVSGKNKTTYKKVNIKKPVLTEENSINIFDMINTSEPEYEYETEFEEYYYPWVYVEFEGDYFFGNDKGNIPVRNLLESFGYTVTYNNGVIRATNTSKYAEYEWLEVYMNSSAVITSENKFFMNSTIKNIDGRAYIEMKDAELLMNSEVDYMSYYPMDNLCDISFVRNKTEEDF